MEYQQQNPILLSLIVVVNIIWWMIMIAAIGLGAMHLGSCPVQPYIPIYLIVLGVSSLLSLILTYVQSSSKESAVHILTSACITILHLLNFCWFISGTVWVYAIYPPNYSAGEDEYCQKIVYQFAFVFTSLCWLLVIVMFICGGCYLLLTCYKIASARRSLSNLHNTSYGGTSDFQEDSATKV